MHILWLKTELLHPVDKGGRIRTYQMLRALRRSHRITYLTLDEGSDEEARTLAAEYCHTLVRVEFNPAAKGTPGFYLDLVRNLASRLPYAVARYRSRRMRSRLEELVARENVDVVVCDFLAPSINVPQALPVPLVLFQHNVEAVIWERHTAVATTAVRRAYMRMQWDRMRRFEGSECRRADHVVAVSTGDRDYFQREYGVASTSDVPTGVDTEYFTPLPLQSDPFELVFTGSMDWMPNEDGILHFAESVLPLIRKSEPRATLTIVGRNPGRRLLALAESDPGIRVTGRVPDVRPYLQRAAVTIVPLRIGGGTRLKIYEALAMERPLVSTTIGAEGLPLEHERELLLADTDEEVAGAIVALLADPARARALGRRAGALVRERFGWDAAAAAFAAACEGAVEAHKRANGGAESLRSAASRG